MRRYLSLAALVLLFAVAGPSSLVPVFGLSPEAIQLSWTPVALDPHKSKNVRVGDLTFLRGWQLTSNSEQLGGVSALRAYRDGMVGVMDTGALLFFGIQRSAARIAPVAPRCGRNRVRLGYDLEGLDTDGANIWVSAEWHNAICRLGMDGKAAGIRPDSMVDWPRRSGPETMLRLRDGRFLVLPEDSSHAALLFPGDPVTGVKPRKLMYTPPKGYWPTDAAELPDGRIVILNREFAPSSGLNGFSTTLVLFDGLPEHGTLQGRTIATLAAPMIHDNFEGIAARRDGDATILTLVSDDNYSWWQRTLLLEFRLND